MPQFTAVIGQKYHPDGSLRLFPGNTIICDLSRDEEVSKELTWAQNQYKQVPFAHKFGFLPPSSFHMTVFDLVCDQVRDAAYWSSFIPLEISLDAADEILRNKVNEIAPPDSFTMEFVECFMRTVIGAKLRPANDDTAKLLQQYRQNVSNLTGIRFPNFDTYTFHISLAYCLERLTDSESEVFAEVKETVNARLCKTLRLINTGMPKFVLFNDMGDFQERLTRPSQLQEGACENA